MIQVNDVSKSFNSVPALSHLQMHVPKGSIYGLVGPNGAGKSTIIRHLVGTYRQDAGQILINGEPVWENAAIKAQIAFIPDDIFYFAQANTLDMMKYYSGLYPTFDEHFFYQICKCFPMLNLKRPIRSLSKGTIKQVAFVLSLACRPELLILDEPVDGLDPVMRRQIWSLVMGEVADRHMTVFVSSHNLRELEDVCDHVGIMNQGHLLIERSLDDLQSSITKIQVAFEDDMPPIPNGIELLHKITNGRVSTLILKGEPQEAQRKMEALHPLFIDILPLTLEEIFIYELGGEHYGVKNIIF